MTCKHCGKELDCEADVCDECKAKAAENELLTPPPTAEYNPRMVGFKPALTGAIAAAIAQIVAAVSVALLYSGWFGAILGLLFLAAAIVFCVPAAIMGIHSILLSVRLKKAGQPLPVATLVLGIVACALALGTAVTVPVNFLTWLIALL
ncbi:MAG: hypothetical protein E7380_06465 [Clostridiales bacterium]|nr:hypothetical protein [Clostridiales bacterium]